jgi:hypothetical protein
VYRLAENIQVRQESWGLLFYSQLGHKIVFVKCFDWLQPKHFNGTWALTDIVNDASARTGTSSGLLDCALRKSIDNLLKNGMVINELR